MAFYKIFKVGFNAKPFFFEFKKLQFIKQQINLVNFCILSPSIDKKKVFNFL